MKSVHFRKRGNSEGNTNKEKGKVPRTKQKGRDAVCQTKCEAERNRFINGCRRNVKDLGSQEDCKILSKYHCRIMHNEL